VKVLLVIDVTRKKTDIKEKRGYSFCGVSKAMHMKSMHQ
jgi:hypothetical protein